MEFKIYLVEDHPVVRRGYASFIGRTEDFSVVGEAANAQDALEQIPAVEPDLVIIDVSLEGQSGLELTKQLRALMPDLPMLVVTIHEEELYAERALKAGARGFMMKDEAEETLIGALRTVLRGRTYLSPRMNQQLMRKSLGLMESPTTPLQQLTDRELEVFEHMGRGQTTREIADQMFISPRTIETHRRAIRKKLRASTDEKLTEEAVLWLHKTTQEKK